MFLVVYDAVRSFLGPSMIGGASRRIAYVEPGFREKCSTKKSQK